MRADVRADSQPVRDPALRQLYAEIAGRLFAEARRLYAANQRGESRVVERDAWYCWFVASGCSPRVAEAKAAAEVKAGWRRERPKPPDKLLPFQPPTGMFGLPEDPVAVLREWRLDPELVELASRFTEREWLAAGLIDGYRLKAWQAADILGCSVKAVESAYARARAKYTAARTERDEWVKLKDNIPRIFGP